MPSVGKVGCSEIAPFQHGNRLCELSRAVIEAVLKGKATCTWRLPQPPRTRGEAMTAHPAHALRDLDANQTSSLARWKKFPASSPCYLLDDLGHTPDHMRLGSNNMPRDLGARVGY